jgi:hypothetical protein
VALLHDGVDDLITIFPPRDEFRDHLRRMLEIAIHGHDGFAAGQVEACGERNLMAEAARKPDNLESLVSAVKLYGQSVCPISAPVVDEDDLPVASEVIERSDESLGEASKHQLFVPQRDDD